MQQTGDLFLLVFSKVYEKAKTEAKSWAPG